MLQHYRIFSDPEKSTLGCDLWCPWTQILHGTSELQLLLWVTALLLRLVQEDTLSNKIPYWQVAKPVMNTGESSKVWYKNPIISLFCATPVRQWTQFLQPKQKKELITWGRKKTSWGRTEVQKQNFKQKSRALEKIPSVCSLTDPIPPHHTRSFGVEMRNTDLFAKSKNAVQQHDRRFLMMPFEDMSSEPLHMLLLYCSCRRPLIVIISDELGILAILVDDWVHSGMSMTPTLWAAGWQSTHHIDPYRGAKDG